MREPRKERKCGYKWDGEKREWVDSGRGCGQEIFIEKQADGTFKITNAKKGRGGVVGEEHKCHNTGFHGYEPLNRMKIDYADQHKFCGDCLQEFNSDVMPLCPNCFKLQCRKCGNLQVWVAGKGINCFQCGETCDVRQVWNAYQRLYGAYQW